MIEKIFTFVFIFGKWEWAFKVRFRDMNRACFFMCIALTSSNKCYLRPEQLLQSFNVLTRMHSSRMLTVRCSGHLGGGVGLRVGWGCLPRGCLPEGVHLSHRGQNS